MFYQATVARSLWMIFHVGRPKTKLRPPSLDSVGSTDEPRFHLHPKLGPVDVELLGPESRARSLCQSYSGSERTKA